MKQGIFMFQDEATARENVLHAIERAEIISSNLNDKLTLDDEDSRLKWLHEHVIWSDTQEVSSSLLGSSHHFIC